MLTATQIEGLVELYQGEVLGEALFDAMLHAAQTDDQRWKLMIMLQLETETKARLRPAMAAVGADIAESPDHRARGMATAEALDALPWSQKMAAIHAELSATFVPRYEVIAADFGDVSDVAASMVEHERALARMVRLEAEGLAEGSASQVLSLLSHPIPFPRPVAG